MGFITETNTRKIIYPNEPDIFIPSLNIAIEYCGLYWHSELHKSINYHKNKYDMCKLKNIKLITIFQNEWNHNQKITKDKIKYHLNIFNNLKQETGETVFDDLRWPNSDYYLSNGYIQKEVFQPDYYYISHDILIEKNDIATLKQYSKFWNDTISIENNAKINKLYKIWDCGKIKYIKTK